MSLRVVFLFVLFGLATGPHAVQAVGPTPPSTVVLRPADVPGLQRVRSGPISDAQAANADHIPVALLRAHGRQAAYQVAYARPRHTGVFRVENIVALFGGADGAAWDYSRVVRNADRRQAQQRYPGFRAFSVGNLGARRLAISYLVGPSMRRLRVDVVRFQQGRYRVSLQLFAVARSVAPSVETGEATRLARVLAARTG